MLFGALALTLAVLPCWLFNAFASQLDGAVETPAAHIETQTPPEDLTSEASYVVPSPLWMVGSQGQRVPPSYKLPSWAHAKRRHIHNRSVLDRASPDSCCPRHRPEYCSLLKQPNAVLKTASPAPYYVGRWGEFETIARPLPNRSHVGRSFGALAQGRSVLKTSIALLHLRVFESPQSMPLNLGRNAATGEMGAPFETAPRATDSNSSGTL